MPTLEQQLGYFAVKVGTGSGCIFQPNTDQYTYVLTVGHNLLAGHENETIIRRGDLTGDPLVIQAVHRHPGLNIDLALIVVDYIPPGEFRSYYAKSERPESLMIYGYPNRLQHEEVKTEDLRCTRSLDVAGGVKYEMETVNAQLSFDAGVGTNVVGFSGSGIFFMTEDEKFIILKGIFPALKHPSGANNKVFAYHIDNFNAIIEQQGLERLIPTCLESFHCYIPIAFDTIDAEKREILLTHSNNIIDQGLSPLMVTEFFQGNLFTPYSEKYINKILNSDLWKSWIELLTFCKASAEDPDADINILYDKLRLYHSEKGQRMEDIVKELLTDPKNLSLIKDNDIVTISNSKKPGINKVIHKEKIRNILTNVYRNGSDKTGFQLNKPQKEIPSMTCVHIDHFHDKVEAVVANDDENLEDVIKNEILKIFQYGQD
jgi:hypothetical protein